MIRQSAIWLTDMVNELLDVAKIESGTMQLRAEAFHVLALFRSLCGTLRPLATNEAVASATMVQRWSSAQATTRV